MGWKPLLDEAELRLVEGAGHSLSEPGIGEAVLQAIEDMKQRR